MRSVVPQVVHLNRVLVSNVFLVDAGREGRFLVDTGHRAERWVLLRELARAGCAPGELAGVLLTHRHSDHAGNAAFLRQRFGVKLYAHRQDAEVLEGTAPRPLLIRGGEPVIEGVLARIEDHFPSRYTCVDRHLEDGDEVAGLEVHWVPGHTLGSAFYRHAPSGCLFTGDMLLNAAPPLTLRPGLRGPYPTFSDDMKRAHASLHAFQARGASYDVVLSGHGPALVGGARSRVDRLLEGLSA